MVGDGRGGRGVIAHDEQVCGLDGPGTPPTCPGCIAASIPPAPPRCYHPALALARRLRREGATQWDAKRQVFEALRIPPLTDLGDAVCAAVAAAYAPDDSDAQLDDLLDGILRRLVVRPDVIHWLREALAVAD
jgi:hypothetical protein